MFVHGHDWVSWVIGRGIAWAVVARVLMVWASLSCAFALVFDLASLGRNCQMQKSKGTLCAAALVACCAATAVAQTTGVDVIVGDLYDVAQYTNAGTINGKRSYAVGTTSCNIGTVPLTWIRNSAAKYPVISQNLYRLSSGRFEQISQAWLKHGYCALNGTICGPCPTQSTPACAYLMPQCSDPYSAGLNGDQSDLGPKWHINPTTGAIAFPANTASWTAVNESGDASAVLTKRLVVPETDITTPGALYFISSSYIQPEDAAANNDNNNQSYRRITFNATSKAMELRNSTQRQKPGIQAWRDFGGGVDASGNAIPDNSVIITPVDVASDGRYFIGVKVITLGANQYRYEYAVQNLNSNRGASSFTVPVPATAAVTNIQFRDVVYHSGEKQKSDNWTGTFSNGAVTWVMPNLYADDQQENALRWDTIYGFSFETNIPPANGTADIGLFLAGTGASASGATLVPSTTGNVGPFNDNCANAQPIGPGATSISTTGATTDGPDQPGQCVVSNYTQIGNDVWFTYTSGSCAGDTTFSICDATFDTKMAVYSACGGVFLACSDDSAGCGTSGHGSTITLAAASNTTYWIRLGGFQGATGTGTLNVAVPNCGPQNEICSTATWLTDSVQVTGNNTGTTVDVTDPALVGCSGNNAPDLWYRYRPATSGNATFQTCGSALDTTIALYASCTATTPLACNDDTTGCSAGGNANYGSLITRALKAGTTYYVRVAGYNGGTGAFNLIVNGGGGTAPPQNDDCANRAGIPLGNTGFNTSGASTDGPIHGTTQLHNDVWFNHPATVNGQLTVSTCPGSAFPSIVAVYSGSGCTNYDARLLGFSSVSACGANRASLTVPVTAGNNYTIRVGGTTSTARGAATLNLAFVPDVPACDSIDFNNDGVFPSDQDVVDFFDVLAGGACPACSDVDFNNNGVFPEDQDVTDFFNVLAGGSCP